jgi:hypothetical protein
MQHLQETNLAWLLIEAAKPELDTRERNHIFICVGAGDSFTAIRILIKLIAAKQICLHPHLAQLCATWLDAYALHEDHERIRLLIDGFVAPAARHRARQIGRPPIPTKNAVVQAVSAAAS